MAWPDNHPDRQGQEQIPVSSLLPPRPRRASGEPPVKWLVALPVVLLLLLVMRRSQKKSSEPALRLSRPPAPAADRKVENFRLLEGAACIYEEGAYVLKGRLVQVQDSSGSLHFTVQVLRAQGLSDSPDERMHLEASRNLVDHTGQVLHSRQTHWRLYFDRALIERVEEMGRSGADLKGIKRVLLEHQMK